MELWQFFILSSYVMTSRGRWRHSRSLSFEHFWQENTSREKSYHPPVGYSTFTSMDSNQNPQCPEKMCKWWIYGGECGSGGCSSIQFRPKSKHSVMFLRHKQSTSGFDVSDITAEKMPVARKTEVIFFNFRRHHNPVRSRRLDKDLTGIFAVTLVRRLKEIKSKRHTWYTIIYWCLSYRFKGKEWKGFNKCDYYWVY